MSMIHVCTLGAGLVNRLDLMTGFEVLLAFFCTISFCLYMGDIMDTVTIKTGYSGYSLVCASCYLSSVLRSSLLSVLSWTLLYNCPAFTNKNSSVSIFVRAEQSII